MSTTAEKIPETKQVSINELKPAAPVDVRSLPAIRTGFDTLQAFELMQRQAKLLASSSLVPKEFQDNLANCVIALEMANRIGASPLMVMQNLDIIYGRPSWRAQFTIACFNQCGRFSAIRYRWAGKEGNDDWSCQAIATELNTGEVIAGPVISIAIAKKEGWYQKKDSKWQSIPQLMLMYRAGAWLVRTHAPEITMGLQTADELHDTYDAEKLANGRFAVTTESLRRAAEVPDQKPALPYFNTESAITAIRNTATVAQLDQVLANIRKDFTDTAREFPVEIDGAYSDKKAALEQKL